MNVNHSYTKIIGYVDNTKYVLFNNIIQVLFLTKDTIYVVHISLQISSPLSDFRCSTTTTTTIFSLIIYSRTALTQGRHYCYSRSQLRLFLLYAAYQKNRASVRAH